MYPSQKKDAEKLKALRDCKFREEKIFPKLKREVLQRIEYPYFAGNSRDAQPQVLRKSDRSRRKPNVYDIDEVPIPTKPILPLPQHMTRNYNYRGPISKRNYRELTPTPKFKRIDQNQYVPGSLTPTTDPTLTREWKNLELPVGMKTNNISTQANASRSPDSSVTTMDSVALHGDVSSGFLDQFCTNKYWEDGVYQKSINANFHYDRDMEAHYKKFGGYPKNKNLVRPWKQPAKTKENSQYKDVKFRLRIAHPGSKIRSPFSPDENMNDIIQDNNNYTDPMDTNPGICYPVSNARRDVIEKKQTTKGSSLDPTPSAVVIFKHPDAKLLETLSSVTLKVTDELPPKETTLQTVGQENLSAKVTEPQNLKKSVETQKQMVKGSTPDPTPSPVVISNIPDTKLQETRAYATENIPGKEKATDQENKADEADNPRNLILKKSFRKHKQIQTPDPTPIPTRTFIHPGTKFQGSRTKAIGNISVKETTPKTNNSSAELEPSNLEKSLRKASIHLIQKIARIRYDLSPTEALPKPVPKMNINETKVENERPSSKRNSSKQLTKSYQDENGNSIESTSPEMLAVALIPLPWRVASKRSRHKSKAQIQESIDIQVNAVAENLKTIIDNLNAPNSNSDGPHQNPSKSNHQKQITEKQIHIRSEVDSRVNLCPHIRKTLPIKTKVSPRGLISTQRKPSLSSEVEVHPHMTYLSRRKNFVDITVTKSAPK